MAGYRKPYHPTSEGFPPMDGVLSAPHSSLTSEANLQIKINNSTKCHVTECLSCKLVCDSLLTLASILVGPVPNSSSLLGSLLTLSLAKTRLPNLSYLNNNISPLLLSHLGSLQFVESCRVKVGPGEGKRKVLSVGLGLGLASTQRVPPSEVFCPSVNPLYFFCASTPSKQQQTKGNEESEENKENEDNKVNGEKVWSSRTWKLSEFSLTYCVTITDPINLVGLQNVRQFPRQGFTISCQFSDLCNLTMSEPPPNTPRDRRFSFSPPSFRKFQCAMDKSATPLSPSKSSNTDDNAERPIPSDNTARVFTQGTNDVKCGSSTGDAHQQERVTRSLSSTVHDDSEQIDTDANDIPQCGIEDKNIGEDVSIPHKDVTDLSSDPVSASVCNKDLDCSSKLEHQCIHKTLSIDGISTSRHDKDDDTFPSVETSEYEMEPGVILDVENEGDAEVMRKKGSGTCDLTADLDQLKSGQTTGESDVEGIKKVVPDTDDDFLDQEPKIQEQEVTNTVANDPAVPESDVGSGKSKEDNEEETKDIPDESDSQHKAFDDCLAKCTPHQHSDSSSSYGPHSPPYQGGMAGLDPNHDEEWVPSVIYPDMNLSKSKKRRKRQKKRQELMRSQDSLGKLLSGTQTKEDADHISTFDLGNEEARKRSRLDESDIVSGNLAARKLDVSDCNNQRSFTATLNSTRYGADFEDSEDTHSFLRDGSDREECIQDDLEDMKTKNQDPPAENMEDDNNCKEGKEENQDDSLSSNSTGAKRKRKRTKKTTKPPKIDHSAPGGQDQQRRETRSKAQAKQVQPTIPEQHDVDATRTSPMKGEKEKPTGPMATKDPPQESGVPDPPSQAVAVSSSSQVGLFKQPAQCSRSDIQKIVSRAVQKSKNRTSNNFAFNSKIQRFHITTDSSTIEKLPTIDTLSPMIEITIPEFIWSDVDKTMEGLVNVKTRGVVQFIILARSGNSKVESWDAPKIDIVRDFASFLLCTIAELKLEFGSILRWTNAWGSVAVMGLDSADLDKLLKFRTFFTTLRYNHHYFNTFPKDAMTNNYGLSILLKSDLREFKEEFLAEALFARNDLHGILDTLQAETFTAADTTRAGVSKNGWRNVLLEGDEAFFKSLSTFTANHWFNIGPASVQIHGGERRAETYAEMEAKSKRKRFNMPVGQTLSTAAQEAINTSFMEDQRALVLAKEKKMANKAPATAPAPSHPLASGSKGAFFKKKK